MVFATNADSQTAYVTIQVSNAQIKEIMNQIEKQTDYLFVYNYDNVDLLRKVTLQMSNAPVAEVLTKIFEHSDVIYAMEGSNILLMKKHESPDKKQSTRRITGRVQDAYGEPVIGANIMEKGTSNGVITDVDGRYSLDVEMTASVLVVSYIGYITQEIPIGNNREINVLLAEDLKMLDEIVVVGYGTQRKGEVASAITSVKSESFVKVPSPDAAQLIRGQIAGLAIISPDANPTSTSQIILRGITTLKSSASPLVIIDGIPGDLISVSPDDIEQIDVLKDGSAAAIYGTRGTNGVIIITTKNVKGEVPTTIDVNAYLSSQQITRKLPFMSIDQYLEKVALGKPGAIDNGGRVNWLDEVLQSPFTQVYNVSLRGGSRSTNYTASLEYRGLEGIIQRSNNQMIYPRIEITHRMFDNKLRINASLSGYQQTYFSGSDGSSYNSGVYRNALNFNPTDPVKDANGVWSESPSKTDYFNPLALLWEVEGENLATNLRMFTNVVFAPVEGLDIKFLISSNTYNQVRGYYETQKHISTVKDGRNGYASRGATRSVDNMAELTAQYAKTLFEDHNLTVLGGYSWLKNAYQDFWMQNWDFPSDDYTYNSMQSGQALRDGRANENSYQRENMLIGYFGRLNYSYKGKYMLAASVRYEGSSKFGINHKWGTFPAASMAWNIKGERFLQNVDVLSTLKLRAGYGVTGTEPTDPYMSLNTLSFGDYAYVNGAWIKSIRPESNPNPDLRWERKTETNIGIDIGLFDERLTGSIDVYNRDTKDLLWDYTVPSPPYLFSSMTANAGSMRNTGVEVSLRAIPVETNDFQWITNVNYSTNKNTLLSLSNDRFISSGYSDQGGTGEPMQQPTHRIKEGQPIGNFYGFKSIDIDENGHWIIEGEDGNPKPISQQQPTDKKIIGNGLPKHYLNWNNSISYKNVDLGITMRGAFGFQILNMAELQFAVPVMLSRGNIMQKAYDHVYGKRPLADDQELQYISYYIEDGDYWKIDNLTVGYTLNFNSKWIQRFRLYGSIANLAVITGYGGIDPEVSISGLAPGLDDKNRYPAARTFTIGASFKF
jgi:TonB-linked SusC/RagA family outer membrane protein